MAAHAAGGLLRHILSAGQQEISNAMATKGAQKFVGVEWRPSPTDVPVIDGVLGYVDRTIDKVHEAGDHYIVVGRVKELAMGEAAGDDPILFHQGQCRTTDG